MSESAADRRTRTGAPGATATTGGVLLVAAVVLVALNLRPAITTVGPLLDQVRSSLGASAAWASLLTTVPVLCFAAASVLAPMAARRVGVGATVTTALALLAAGLVVRVLGGPVPMVLATMVAAGGIAICAVLLPVVVKASFPTRVGLLTGLYTAALQTGAALGFALSPPASAALGGWRPALGWWALLPVLALVVWVAAGRGLRARAVAAAPARGRRRSLWASPLAWIVTGFFGLQAFVAFAVTGWLAQVLLDTGVDRGSVGLLMGLLTIVALPVSLLVPPLAARSAGQSGWIVGLGGCGFLGVLGLLLAPASVPLLWCLLLGLGMSVFSLALTVVALRAGSSEDTAQLSGMAQGIGYLVAALGPLAFGVLHDLSGNWSVPLVLLLVVIVVQTVAGALAGRPGRV